MPVEQRIRQFVQESFFVVGSNIADDTSLIAEGIVDSTGILEIIAFLESEYGIQISDVDTTPENLETIGRIAAFVERKCASVAGVSTG